MGTLLLILSQAVAVPMKESSALGADDWMGSNADGAGAPGADGPRVHLVVPRTKENKPEMQGGVGSSGRRIGGLCASHSESWVCSAGFEDLRSKAASPCGTPREGSGSLSPKEIAVAIGHNKGINLEYVRNFDHTL